MHLSLQYGSIIIMVQIYVNVAASQPDYGIPILLISRLNESLTKWKLWHRVSFREMTSQNKWISDVYLKKTFAVKENRNQHSILPIVLGFHPHAASHLYLNLNCESDHQMGVYNVRKRTLNFVSKCWHHSSFPRYQLFCCQLWSAVSQIVLPSWPTPIPQISLSQSQEAALPCQGYSLT
ncbi:hypothetical protein L6164_017970 [Bauhinia variegata]|uniref:Uncharacterized protein n=1 Tax=Bauhinia variegata TaxID=167791 RepID=A0ACB9N9T0_BAUVA|nr:hypothetical protein L6164_017970 [Bauhinia variegata]